MADAEQSGSREATPAQDNSNFDLTKAFMSLSDEQKEQAVKIMIRTLTPNDLPPENPLFELFSVRVEFERDRRGELYGYIDGHVEGDDDVVFFDCDEASSQSICNKGFVSLVGPNRSLPVSLELHVDLYVKVKGEVEEEEELQVGNIIVCRDYTTRPDKYYYNQCRSCVITGKHGYVTLYYTALFYAVQATVEATLEAPDGGLSDVYGSIIAYYGNFKYDVEPHEKEFFRVTLLDRPKGKYAALKNGGIPLSRSVVAVPSRCSLVIEAKFWDFDSKVEIMSDTFTFPALLQGSSNGHIEGQGCHISFKVDWKCQVLDSN